jgi:AcrR family transcriptional regulator
MSYLRKRPRQARSRATFDAIVEAAARILVEAGPARLTTNRVAARAGVSIGSLYQYFPGRAAIVRALVERELERAEALRPAALDDATVPVAVRLRAVVDWHLDVHAASPDLARALRGLVPHVLPLEEIRRLARLRSRRTGRMLASLGVGRTRDLESAVFIVETCLEALTGAATARRPGWLRSERFRGEMAALLGGYLCPPLAEAPAARTRLDGRKRRGR